MSLPGKCALAVPSGTSQGASSRKQPLQFTGSIYESPRSNYRHCAGVWRRFTAGLR